MFLYGKFVFQYQFHLYHSFDAYLKYGCLSILTTQLLEYLLYVKVKPICHFFYKCIIKFHK